MQAVTAHPAGEKRQKGFQHGKFFLHFRLFQCRFQLQHDKKMIPASGRIPAVVIQHCRDIIKAVKIVFHFPASQIFSARAATLFTSALRSPASTRFTP